MENLVPKEKELLLAAARALIKLHETEEKKWLAEEKRQMQLIKTATICMENKQNVVIGLKNGREFSGRVLFINPESRLLIVTKENFFCLSRKLLVHASEISYIIEYGQLSSAFNFIFFAQ